MLGRALRLSALPSLQGSQVLGSPFPFPNTEGRLKMGQTPTRRRGPQGKPAQQGSPQWVRSGDGVKSVVTEQRYRPAQQGSPPIPVEPSLESRRAANPERYGPVEHFVVTNGVWRRIPVEREAKREPLPRRVANDGKAYTYKEFFDFYKKDAPKRWRDAGHEGSVERTVEEHGPPEEYIKQQPEYVKQQQELQRQSWRSSTKRKATGGLLVHEDSWDGRMCPRHRLAGREAGPHPFQSVMVCGCCAGTCELCDLKLDPYN